MQVKLIRAKYTEVLQIKYKTLNNLKIIINSSEVSDKRLDYLKARGIFRN